MEIDQELRLKIESLENLPKSRSRALKLTISVNITPIYSENDENRDDNEDDSDKFVLSLGVANETLKYAPWMPDYAADNCLECGLPFTLIRRRHHCRYCGKLFCSSCAFSFMHLPLSFELRGLQRVCGKCSSELKPIQSYVEKSMKNEDKPVDFFINFEEEVNTPRLEDSSDIIGFHDTFVSTGISTLSKENQPEAIKNKIILKDAYVIITVKNRASDKVIGETRIRISFLSRKHSRKLMLFDSYGDLVVSSNNYLPLFIQVHLQGLKRKDDSPVNYLSYPKHIMMITRGTQGDVQPFVALARGLASIYGFCVTILAELRFRDFIVKNSSVRQGKISFRPVGGDTKVTIDSRLGKWAISLESDIMNTIMLSRSEVQFFNSEPAVFYYAKQLKPDALIFGFTMAAVTMIVSEALQIPLLGFILQPTCIPSERFPPIFPLDQATYDKLKDLKGMKNSHNYIAHLKEVFENNPITNMLNAMRSRRGLIKLSQTEEGSSLLVNAVGALGYPTTNKTWRELTKQNIPMVIPISPAIFGEKPDEWSENTVLTENIFLKPKGLPALDDDLLQFIESAKSEGMKLVVLAFSSMPVSARRILKVATKLISKCTPRVAVIALIGDHKFNIDVLSYSESSAPSPKIESSNSLPSLDVEHKGMKEQTQQTLVKVMDNLPGVISKAASVKRLRQAADDYIREKRLYVAKQAPFGRLFPLMDCIVAHGGLGTTGDAIITGVPLIITGVLLLDQRFWGVRCKELEIGPYPIHINHFKNECVSLVNQALAENSLWTRKARDLSQMIKSRFEHRNDDDLSGVTVNAAMTTSLLENAKPYHYEAPEKFLISTINKISNFR